MLASRNRPAALFILTLLLAPFFAACPDRSHRNRGRGGTTLPPPPPPPPSVPGDVLTWGSNTYGQQGDGSFIDGPVPTVVLDPAGPGGRLTEVTDISVGRFHVLAVLRDGTVRAWGAGYLGQLGDGARSDSTEPVQVVDLSDPTGFLQNAAIVEAGAFHSFVRLHDGTLRGFGANHSGQLGTGGFDTEIVPTRVIDPSDPTGFLQNVAEVTASPYGGLQVGHSVALLMDRTLRAWGSNVGYQLGTGGSNVATPVPAPVLDPADTASVLRDVMMVRAGSSYSLALLWDRTVATWGWGWDSRSSPVPGRVSDPTDPSGMLRGVIDIDVGFRFNLAVLADFTVRTWGRNSHGELGIGTYGPYVVYDPTPVVDPSDPSGLLQNVRRVRGGTRCALAVLRDGTVRTWGSNSRFALGDGTMVDSPVPVQVVDPTDPTGFLTGVIDAGQGAWAGAVLKP